MAERGWLQRAFRFFRLEYDAAIWRRAIRQTIATVRHYAVAEWLGAVVTAFVSFVTTEGTVLEKLAAGALYPMAGFVLWMFAYLAIRVGSGPADRDDKARRIIAKQKAKIAALGQHGQIKAFVSFQQHGMHKIEPPGDMRLEIYVVLEFVNREDVPLVLSPELLMELQDGTTCGPYEIWIHNQAAKTVRVGPRDRERFTVYARELFNPVPEQFADKFSYTSGGKFKDLRVTLTDKLTRREVIVRLKEPYDVH